MILNRKDTLGCAQTGTGKTASFALPIIQLVHNHEVLKARKIRLRALIVTPTRELAIQIGENFRSYSKYTDVKHCVIFGGVGKEPQIKALRKGAHVLIATPGRLLDLIGSGHISLNTIKVFVLDEADRMLDMGFIHDIKKLLKQLPEKRQNLFFSATLPPNIIELSDTILNNPVKIETTRVSSSADTIEQLVYYTNKNTKRGLLLHLLRDPNVQQVLVFARTKHGADRVCKNLNRAGIDALAIHGNKSQNQRQNALAKFKDLRIKVLVATDIAARGIDIQNLELVINYDIPNESETYVHRIGRSGRAGNNGMAISIAEPEENAYIRDIERLIGKQISVVKDHPFPQTDKPMTTREKKEFEKQKRENRQKYFENRKRKKVVR